MNIRELSRTVAFRLTLFYSLFFMACVILLLGFVYWKTASEMTHRIDQVLLLERTDFSNASLDSLSIRISDSIRGDRRHVYFYGLFAPDGQSLAGNVLTLPADLPADGAIYQINLSPANFPAPSLAVRGLVIHLASGHQLLLGYNATQLVDFGLIMKKAFIWGGALTILLGLAFGLALSFSPLRRIEQIREVCERIVRGDFRQRLPVTRRQDELDLLAAIVNRMLDQIERLMSEVKSVGDNIAHDLRTPLTRLRAMLYRVQQQMNEVPAQRDMVERAIGEVDSLLLKFRALLRISEIDNKQRIAGFKTVQLQSILEQAVGFFEPLAEDRSINLNLMVDEVEAVRGDEELLFEAISNLLDNAIKFTQIGGEIKVHLGRGPGGPQIDIVDNGTGIEIDERAAVLNRFYRGSNVAQVPGHGLGLSLVMAIVRLHDFKLELSGANPGTRATLFCWPHSL